MRQVIRFFLLLAAVGAGSGSLAADVRGLQSLDATHRHVLDSRRTDHRYHVFVGLPDGYESLPEKRFPVVYVLDGGELYPMFVTYSRYLQSNEEVPELIVVGISYGTRDWRQGNDRSHDFTAPSAERDFWGGAADFAAFLETELVPKIESEYRADPARRIVFGQSLGGQFALFAAQRKPGLFWGHIASNPALHRNLPFFLDASPAVGDSPTSKLFVSSGTADIAQFRTPALEWIAHWEAQPTRPWVLRTLDLPGYGHFSAAPAAYRAGLRWLFEGD